jgi:hypothetical protein
MNPYRFRITFGDKTAEVAVEVPGGPAGAPAPAGAPQKWAYRNGWPADAAPPQSPSALVAWPGAARDGGGDAASAGFLRRCMLGTFVRQEPGEGWGGAPPSRRWARAAREAACRQAEAAGGWPRTPGPPPPGSRLGPQADWAWELRVAEGPLHGRVAPPAPGLSLEDCYGPEGCGEPEHRRFGPGSEPGRDHYR